MMRTMMMMMMMMIKQSHNLKKMLRRKEKSFINATLPSLTNLMLVFCSYSRLARVPKSETSKIAGTELLMANTHR